MDAEWVLCPLCGGKTRDKIREDTVLINYSLYCPKCKHECLIKAEHLHHMYMRCISAIHSKIFILDLTFNS